MCTKCLMNNLHEPPGFFLFFHSHPLIASLLSFLSFTHLLQTFPFVSFPRWSHSFCPNDVVKRTNGNKSEPTQATATATLPNFNIFCS